MRRGTVAIVGRPNVGKSTLFNRIVGGRPAIVHDRPGVTRDRNFGESEWNGRHFWVVDTGGWVTGEDDPIARGIREQVGQAVADADVVLFVVDTQAGIHPADIEVAEWLRRTPDRVILVANKADHLPEETGHFDFFQLGLGEPVPVSAAIGKGSGDLLDRVAAQLPDLEAGDEADDVVEVAVIGRPNVGKSSLVNRLLGVDRAIVSPEAGTTRDAVDSPLRYHGRTLNFIDTAGLRKRPKVKDDVEFYSTLRSERALQRADVCVLVVDASTGMHTQDLRVAQRAWDEGRGLIIAANKWDLVAEKDTDTADRDRRRIEERAPFLRHAPFVFLSALTGQRSRKILDLILDVAEARRRRVDTSDVNEVLERLVARAQPPQAVGREVRILYGTQIGVAPPTFAIISNRPDAVPESYQRYLKKGFYEAWPFRGTTLRLRMRRKRESR